MATLKFIIKNKPKVNSKHAVYLRLTHNRKPTTIKTDIDVFNKEWQSDTGTIKKIKNGSSNINKLNHRLSKLHTKVYEIIERLEDENKLDYLSVTELRAIILNKKDKQKVFTFWQKFIDTNTFNSINTKKAHINALSSFKKFNKGQDLNFEFVNVAFLEDYENWNLSKGNSYNGFATNLNMLKIIYNKAIDRNIVVRDKYPFNRFKVKNNIPDKRALTKDEVELIKECETTEPKLIEARNIFLISYYMGGIAFIDLCKLKYENITDNHIIYARSKTGVVVELLINDQLGVLLNIYLQSGKKPSDYIFSFITNDNLIKGDLEYKRAWQNYNNALKRLGKLCNISATITTYVARHTFATLGLNTFEFPLNMVKTALGHKNIRTTQHYVANFKADNMKQHLAKM